MLHPERINITDRNRTFIDLYFILCRRNFNNFLFTFIIFFFFCLCFLMNMFNNYIIVS